MSTSVALPSPAENPVAAGPPLSVHLVTLGCARNEVDSEELAARLADGGFALVADPADADAVMVNTCGFVEAAKKDSVDTLLAAADLKSTGRPQAVVAVGCLAERYGSELADALPEADAVLGFDHYADVADRLQHILAGEHHQPHVPRDRRKLLPVAPAARPAAAGAVAIPGHGSDRRRGRSRSDGLDRAPASGPRTVRRRLDGGPSAPLKIASGCDRRCTFCAIPAFRGSYVSRPRADIVTEARWLVGEGVREVFLVSENSSSYGKDLGDIRALEAVARRPLGHRGTGMDPGLLSAARRDAAEPDRGHQPAPTRWSRTSTCPSSTPRPRCCGGMRRFGDPDSFLGLIESIRAVAPRAGIRSNVICGFPGETERDQEILAEFLTAAELDAIGVFGYSDEDGTAAQGLPDQHPIELVESRRAQIADLADELVNQRAEDRIGEPVRVLVEEVQLGRRRPG